MLRIQFTDDDLLDTRVAAAPDPLFELAASVRLLRASAPTAPLARWRSRTRAALTAAGLTLEVRPLLDLAPAGTPYIPDFLTPANGAADLESGIDTVLSTPRQRLHADLAAAARIVPLPGWTRDLADGDPDALNRLGRAIRAYHAVAVAPHWPEIEAHATADRAIRGQLLLDRGVEGLLATLHPDLTWTAGSLVYCRSQPHEYTMTLDGRGLLLVPSYFAHEPMALDAPGRPVVLLYPTHREAPPARAGRSLAALLGRTRARVLASLTTGCTTTQLAQRVGISLASASQHAAVLRDAGLVASRRTGSAVLHTLTPLGSRLLRDSSRGRALNHIVSDQPPQQVVRQSNS
jgi:DNA-binding transcriptional ArsR family regulator